MLLHGDCLEKLKELSENSVDAIITDPPYGINFMGKTWDDDCPSVEVWKECLRVLKPGGHLLSFSGTRTVDLIMGRIREAGFEVRDMISWIYGSGFPKSHNIEKALNKKGEIERAKEFKGFGTALKPACEPIVVARKPFKGSVVDNVLKHGCGGLNIDACRVEHNINPKYTNRTASKSNGEKMGLFKENGKLATLKPQGRFPANVILDEEASKLLDEQSGVLKSGTLTPQNNVKATTGWSGGSQADRVKNNFQANSGGASRFFYCPKASKRERNEGLEGMPKKKNDFQRASSGLSKSNKGRAGLQDNSGQPNENHHPTVKPIKLMQYLVKLVTPPNGIVLDPFMGSGSTGVACAKLGFNFIGIEREKEYYNIAEKRINHEGDKYALI